jgi:DNA polymerase-3 subunit delta'
MASLTNATIWEEVVGQERAIERLRASAVEPVHAYLFVGPPGSTKDAAARAFAALLLSGGEDPDRREARLALAGQHPDVRDEFHLLQAHGAARLLKTLEEPPPSTFFIVLADQVTLDLTTIASRCVRIEFGAIDPNTIVDRLVAEGCDRAAAAEAAAAAAGSLDRARVLVSDPGLARRRAAFASVPSRLDGTGATVVALCDEITRLADEATAPLTAVHAAEVAALEERVAATGERGSGRKTLEERHKRAVRRYRIDELRSALAVMAGVYRDALTSGRTPRPDITARAVTRIHDSLEAFERNPNEALLLQSLLLDLPALDLPALAST